MTPSNWPSQHADADIPGVPARMDRRLAIQATVAAVAFPSILLRPRVALSSGLSSARAASLARAVGCPVSEPGVAGFDALRTSWNGCWQSQPVAIAHPRTAAEVAAIVRWSRAEGVPLRIRSGGHSFIGDSLCDGVIVDMSALAATAPGPVGGTVRVGGGALLGPVAGALYHRHGGSTCTLGTCDSVGLGGLLLGGGFNGMSRVHGLTIDALRAAQVVLADGRIVTADERTMPDLFWALRGGGASFGAVTEVTLRTRPWTATHVVTQHWPWQRAAEVLPAWSAFIESLPADASSSLVWSTSGTDRSSSIRTLVRSERGPDHAAKLAAGLERAVGAAPARTARNSTRPPSDGDPPRTAGPRSANSSVFAAQPVTESVARRIAAAMDQRRRSHDDFGGSTCMLICNAFGGAVAKVPADATAFVHRDARFLAEFAAEWPMERGTAEVDAANRAWVRGLSDAVRPGLGQGSYLNYADPGMADWRRAYWGANLARLEAVKATFDPGRMFGGKQVV